MGDQPVHCTRFSSPLWFPPTRHWWHLPLPAHCDNPKRPRHDQCPLGAESALVEKPCSGRPTLIISHNSHHTQVSLPPSSETRSQAGTRHWLYLTPRSGLCAPLLSLEWMESMPSPPTEDSLCAGKTMQRPYSIALLWPIDLGCDITSIRKTSCPSPLLRPATPEIPRSECPWSFRSS